LLDSQYHSMYIPQQWKQWLKTTALNTEKDRLLKSHVDSTLKSKTLFPKEGF